MHFACIQGVVIFEERVPSGYSEHVSAWVGSMLCFPVERKVRVDGVE